MNSVLNESGIEENCCQSVIRSKKILHFNLTCQTIGVLAGATAAVAGFYFSTITGGWNSYALGSAGSALACYSFCGLSYLLDYKKIIIEAKKVKKLEQAKAELEHQVIALENIERGIALEGKEIEGDIVLLKEEVQTLSLHVDYLRSQISETTGKAEIWGRVADKIQDEEEKIAEHIQAFSSDLTAAYKLHAQNHKHRLEAIGALENLDLRIESREKAMIETMARSDEIAKIVKLKEDLETFKAESPQDYEEMISRYSFLRV